MLACPVQHPLTIMEVLMTRIMMLFAALMTAPFLAATAHAHDYVIGDLTIDHPWARPTVTNRQPGGLSHHSQ